MKNDFPFAEELPYIFNDIRTDTKFNVEQIPFKDLDKWTFSRDMYSITHDSGRFFTIEGIQVRTNYGEVQRWDQPVINQHEIGLLGIIMKKFQGVPHYLMQAKVEPGNVNIVQLSPTVQATKSNFDQVHKGKSTPYLEYFMDKNSDIIVDQLQSEQGGKFLKKRNRNMVIEVHDDIKVNDGYFWLRMSQIKYLMSKDNFVNMDARSVISTIPSPLDSFNYGSPMHSDAEISRWYNNQMVKYELDIKRVPLNTLSKWKITDTDIHNDPSFFSVIGIRAEIGGREVNSWTQPIVTDKNIGLCGFIMTKINGVNHYLVQAKVLPGNVDVLDLSPTVSVSNYKGSLKSKMVPFLQELLKGGPNSHVIHDVIQSEEGGRFYHLQNRNMVVYIPDMSNKKIPDNYIWMTLEQIKGFLPMGKLNMETRSLIALL